MNRSFVRLITALTIVTMACLIPAAAFASLCDEGAASQADQDLWNTHGCWSAFYLWQYQQYNESSDDWGDAGWNDACNVNKEFAKMWNASYLVTYGLADNPSQSFHGTTDYRQLAESPNGPFKDAVYYKPVNNPGIYGSFTYHWPGDDEIDLSCTLFDASDSHSNPASRAGDYMHEGWHGWLTEGDWNNGSCGGHYCGPTGNCTVANCDYYYFHGVGAYAFGALWQTNGTASRFHSPNEVQVEFLCDVSDQPKSWVPQSVRSAGAADADYRAVTRFINGPGYRCGEPRPW